MGLRLSRRPKEPFWLALDFGIRMKVRPLQAPMLAAIRVKASRLAKAMEEPQQAERLLAIMDSSAMTDEEIRDGLFQHYVTVLLAQCAIVEWEGVFQGDDADGNPLADDVPGELMAVTDDNIAEAMMVPLVAERFYAGYTVRQSELVAEGNGSGLSSTGTSAVALPIARAATRADAAPAPTKPKRPKRRKVTPH